MDKKSVEELKSKFKSSELSTEGMNEHEAKFWMSVEERVESGKFDLYATAVHLGKALEFARTESRAQASAMADA